MNLLLIGNHLSNPRYSFNIWQELAVRLMAAGHNVLVTSKKSNKLPRLLDMLSTIITQKRKYQIAEVDVFSGQGFIFAYLCTLMLKVIGKPCVLTLHGGNLPSFANKHDHLVKNLLNNAAAVVAPSDYLKQSMKPYCEKIDLIPNALDVSKYRYSNRAQVQPTLIWLRAFHDIYNPQMAIKNLAVLLQGYPDAHLVMIGPDKGDGSLQDTKKLALELGVQNSVTFLGHVPKSEVPVYLNKGDIFLNTTNYDNTPISVIEAMACGLPIVSTKVGGIPFLVRDEVDALLVPQNNPDDMATAVKRILTEPGLASRLSTTGRKKAEKFDWSIILPQWENLFMEVIERHNVQTG